MTTVYDVPPKEMVDALSEKMKSLKEIAPPDWSRFVKTGNHKKRAPTQEDWWFIRCGALLRAIYVHGPVGVQRLRTKYGGRKRWGNNREHFKRGSGNIIRKCLQQLETAGLIEKEKKGRKISKKGMKFVDGLAPGLVKNAGKQ